MAETTAITAAPLRVIDWRAIEGEYRAGRKTLRTIADEYGVSHAAIQKRAKRDCWPRDISARIAAKAEEEVARLAVTKTPKLPEPRPLETTPDEERQIIDANAALQVQTIVEARASVRNAAAAVDRLWSRMDEAEAEGIDLASKVADRLTSALARLVDLRYKVMGIRDYRADEQPTQANSAAEDEAWRALRDKVRQMSQGNEQG